MLCFFCRKDVAEKKKSFQRTNINSFFLLLTERSKDRTSENRCQFHQRFTRAFSVRKRVFDAKILCKSTFLSKILNEKRVRKMLMKLTNIALCCCHEDFVEVKREKNCEKMEKNFTTKTQRKTKTVFSLQVVIWYSFQQTLLMAKIP